jgi:hypothetical protein
MKKCIYIALLCLTSWTVFAQEAEQIDLGPYGTLFVRTNKKPIEYYETQIYIHEQIKHGFVYPNMFLMFDEFIEKNILLK